MKTRVYRIDLSAEEGIDTAIASICDKQHGQGFALASTFVWGNNLVMVFQAPLSTMAPLSTPGL